MTFEYMSYIAGLSTGLFMMLLYTYYLILSKQLLLPPGFVQKPKFKFKSRRKQKTVKQKTGRKPKPKPKKKNGLTAI